ncbi:MAG: TerB family tellurite resistance protein [Rickettsiales bacterium]
MSSLATQFSDFLAMPQTKARVRNDAAASYRLEAVAFTHAVIALGAKLSTIDGAASKEEYAAVHALFVANGTMEEAQARSFFVQRTTDTSSALQYARQIAGMTAGQADLHADLMHRLIQVATSDAAINAAEFELLRAIADVFGMDKETFRSMVSRSVTSVSASPYEVLGVSARATDKEVREHYMARVQTLHPDRYQAAGASKDTIAMLSDQLAALNAAYQSVQQARAKKSSHSAGWFGRKNTKGADTSV